MNMSLNIFNNFGKPTKMKTNFLPCNQFIIQFLI